MCSETIIMNWQHRRSSVPLDNTIQTIHNSCDASGKPSVQLADFPWVGKVKTEQTTHEAHIACGDRCAAIKKHTDVTESTDLSFSRIFFD